MTSQQKIMLPGCQHGLGRVLALESAEGNPIDNIQQNEIGDQELRVFNALLSKYPFALQRTPPSPVYNCHGMTFAARRTCVTDRQTIDQIIKEDKYNRVPDSGVLPGDVLLYFSPTGDAEHSAVVVKPPDQLGVPYVFSKWGKHGEFVHPANHCPYSFQSAIYYRVRHDL